MKNLKYYQFICNIFPPILSQRIRNIIFPISVARQSNLSFSKKSITGSIFQGNISDYHSYRFAIHGFFEWRNIIIAKRYIEKYKGDIVEIGANVGTETISYCDLIANTAKVHAFEPLPENFKSLKELTQRLNNLVVYPNAISNKTAVVNFQLPPKHESGTGKIIENDSNQLIEDSLLVNALPLDAFMNEFKDVCLISIDTEGHEPFVLDGAQIVINKFRPAVIIEVSPKLLRKYAHSSSKNIQQYFIDLNYRCYIIKRSTLVQVNELNLNLKKAENWFCIPSEKAGILKKIKRDLLMRAVIPWYLLKSITTSTNN
ncbi:MAG: FkbM family methyltransferase [Flavobacteriaceae bacterium]|nr:FkbM family methyltransferase [Flavobacteriaceae bacterium]